MESLFSRFVGYAPIPTKKLHIKVTKDRFFQKIDR